MGSTSVCSSDCSAIADTGMKLTFLPIYFSSKYFFRFLGTSLIVGPQSQMSALARALGATYNYNLGGVYTVNCENTLPSIKKLKV